MVTLDKKYLLFNGDAFELMYLMIIVIIDRFNTHYVLSEIK